MSPQDGRIPSQYLVSLRWFYSAIPALHMFCSTDDSCQQARAHGAATYHGSQGSGALLSPTFALYFVIFWLLSH